MKKSIIVISIFLLFCGCTNKKESTKTSKEDDFIIEKNPEKEEKIDKEKLQEITKEALIASIDNDYYKEYHTLKMNKETFMEHLLKELEKISFDGTFDINEIFASPAKVSISFKIKNQDVIEIEEALEDYNTNLYKEELNKILDTIPDGEAPYKYEMEYQSSYGAFILPNTVVDVYVKLEDKRIGLFEKNVKVLAVLDKDGNNFFENSNSNKDSLVLLLSLKESKIKLLNENKVEIVIAPANTEILADDFLSQEEIENLLEKK